MRIITNNELPRDIHRQIVIKSGERSRHQKMAVALERTLSQCREIHAAYEQQAVILRENSKKQGFKAGFQLFFAQLVNLLDEYARRQQQRQIQFRKHLTDALTRALHDPTIVECIIHHLQEHCEHQEVVRIIIPAEVKLPDGADPANYQRTNDNHITVQNDMGAIRFPSESLCQQWLAYADEMISPHDAVTSQLIPDLLRDIAGTLLDLGNQHSSASPHSNQEENNE
ncbi:type III secretion protein [Escherichia coli]|nr:type III secretion protein [Escherichia coli]